MPKTFEDPRKETPRKIKDRVSKVSLQHPEVFHGPRQPGYVKFLESEW